MISRVMFVSKTAAENMAGMTDWAIVSIGEPDAGQAQLMHGWYAIHRASFHDIDVANGAQVLMTEDHAGQIIGFVESVAPHVEGLVVHCQGGISRSAAVAKWVADRFGLPFNHSYALFNRHVYRLMQEAR